jgi:hypothetical protein
MENLSLLTYTITKQIVSIIIQFTLVYQDLSNVPYKIWNIIHNIQIRYKVYNRFFNHLTYM